MRTFGTVPGIVLPMVIALFASSQETTHKIEFNGSTAEENNLVIQGAGFDSFPKADVSFGPVPVDNAFDGATDGRGVTIQADPGEGVMILASALDSPYAAMVRCSVRASHPQVSVTLATVDEGPDVFIAANYPNNGTLFLNRYRRLTVFKAPPTSRFQALIQVINTSPSEPLTVYLDNFNTYLIESDYYYHASFLDGDENDPAMIRVREGDMTGVTPTPTTALPTLTPTPTFDPVMLAEGQMLFENPHLGRRGNFYSCTICHDEGVDGEDGLIRPGHPMRNAAERGVWKNGNAPDLIDAVNACLVDWMNADPLTEEDPLWAALETYIKSLSTGDAPERVDIQVVPPPDPVDGGAFDQGETLFQQLACIECHGTDLLGRRDENGGLYGPFLAYRPQIPLTKEYISAKIRQSGANLSGVYEGLQVGGNMPFWGGNRINDQDVRDLAEYISTVSRWTPEPTMTPTSTPTRQVTPVPTAPPQSNGTGPGWIANFGTGNSHSVEGKVVVTSPTTLRIEDFQYDGGGIAVSLYLIKAAGTTPTGQEGRSGIGVFDFTLGDGYGSRFNGPDVLEVTLPAGITLDQYTHVSVWCVPVGVSFATARFTAPPPEPTATPTPEPPSSTQTSWTADFGTGNSHSVQGKVVVTSPTTLRIEDFQYDGGGIAVSLYLIKAAGTTPTGQEGRSGIGVFDFTLGEGYGSRFNGPNVLEVTLPTGLTIDQYTHVSVWCVPVGVSFGTGRFVAPE